MKTSRLAIIFAILITCLGLITIFSPSRIKTTLSFEDESRIVDGGKLGANNFIDENQVDLLNAEELLDGGKLGANNFIDENQVDLLNAEELLDYTTDRSKSKFSELGGKIYETHENDLSYYLDREGIARLISPETGTLYIDTINNVQYTKQSTGILKVDIPGTIEFKEGNEDIQITTDKVLDYLLYNGVKNCESIELENREDSEFYNYFNVILDKQSNRVWHIKSDRSTNLILSITKDNKEYTVEYGLIEKIIIEDIQQESIDYNKKNFKPIYKRDSQS